MPSAFRGAAMPGDFERGYAFFRQWPRDNMLLWARETDSGRQSMQIIGRTLTIQAASLERRSRSRGRKAA
ncbi:MAG: hypothetical protein WB611_14155 [Stellaceae bacterium]